MASIVVVGGGVAGLACAWRLRRAGHDVEVLERRSQPGGRLAGEQRGPLRLEPSAPLVSPGDRNTRATAAALGIAVGPRSTPRAPAAVLDAGRLRSVDPGAPLRAVTARLLPLRARAGTARLALLRAWHARALEPLWPEAAAALDREDAAAGLRRHAGEDACALVLGPWLAAALESEPEDVSFAQALLALRPEAQLAPPDLEGGVAVLVERLAAAVRVRTSCEVTCVESETGGARARYRSARGEGSVLADAAVVAVAGNEVAELCPKLSPAERGFFERVGYVRSLCVHLALDRPAPVLAHTRIGFPRAEGWELCALAALHTRSGVAPPGSALLRASFSERAAGDLWHASDAALIERALDHMADASLGRPAPHDAVVHRLEAARPRFGAGSLRRLAVFATRLERSPRIAFAGDYLVAAGVEGALTSGMRAATELARGL